MAQETPEKNLAEKFIDALNELEANENVEPIVALYADDCEIGNVTLTHNLSGKDGVRDFWTTYRKTFGKISSKFRNKLAMDGTTALEWTSEGTTENGHEFNYEGVSIIEYQGDKITRFYAYFNPGKLGNQIME